MDGKNQLTSEPAGSCVYDPNGNLTNHAGKVLLYDDENQLVEWRESSSPTSGAVASTFVYDGLGRLRARGGYLGNGSSWVFQSAVYYLYDGMRVIEERDGNNWPQVAYTRGTDLSGSLEGAGGIGGLLARSHDFTNCSSTLTYWLTNNSGYCIYDLAIWDDYGTHVSGAYVENGTTGMFSFAGVPGRTYYVFGWSCDEYYIQTFGDQFTGALETRTVHFVGEGDWNCTEGANCIAESGYPLCDGASSGMWLTHNYYQADGNGNVTALVSSAQTLTASYRYDPFGNTISQSGGLATANTYRFSSKMIHATSGLYYYGYRWYAPNLQRWVNQDPLGEVGGFNLHTFAVNAPVNSYDALGLIAFDEDGFPIMPTGSMLDTYIYDEDAKANHDKIMDDAADAAKDIACNLARTLNEPLDWAMTAEDIVADPTNPWNYAGFIPFVSGGWVKSAAQNTRPPKWRNPGQKPGRWHPQPKIPPHRPPPYIPPRQPPPRWPPQKTPPWPTKPKPPAPQPQPPAPQPPAPQPPP